MARRKKIVATAPVVSHLERQEYLETPDGFIIEHGELIKIKGKNSFGVGEWGLKFRFDALVTNTRNGAQWVDCYEMYRGVAGVLRSFPADRVKRIPKRRRRVNRTANS